MKNQGYQSEAGPTQRYRAGLAALEKACEAKYAGKEFAELSNSDKDKVLSELESGELKLDDSDGRAFVEEIVKDVQMGFFADPIYGGNRDMAAWKMVGYPGLPATYREEIKTYFGKKYDRPPHSIADFV